MPRFFEESGATFDASGAYRYHLWRSWWHPDGKRVAFIMLNPSTANAEDDDPTVRRCIGFAQTWGHAGLDVVNLFAWRATNPRELFDAKYPVGDPTNLDTILRVAVRADLVVAGWGSFPDGARRPRSAIVLQALQNKGVVVYALGVTKNGIPRHPLYLSGDTQPVVYDYARALEALAR